MNHTFQDQRMTHLHQIDSTTLNSDGLEKISAAKKRWPMRMLRLIENLACPHCHGELVERAHDFQCVRCEKSYPIRNGKIYFIEPVKAEDALDVVKSRLKNFLGPKYYHMAVSIVGPSYPFNYGYAVRQQVDPMEQLVIDLGCGNYRIDENVVTLDGTDYEAVDIVADISALPFKDGAIDALCSCSVLEHVADLGGSVDEISRCTRSDGLGIHYIPFMYPFHASPHDYTRLTYIGAARLFTGWKLIEQRNATGPISLFLICFVEFMSTLLSCGVQRLKAPIYLFFCALTFPVKFFDAPFIGRPSFLGLAPTILTVVRKP